MNKYKVFENLSREFYKSENIILDAEIRNYVHLRVGGPADILLTPENREQIIRTIEICNEKNIPFYVVGNGSNLLVKDGGVEGVVIKLNNVKNINVYGDVVETECGAMLKDVSSAALKSSLTGFESACGIPGAVGGAIFMNTGAYNGKVANVIDSIGAIDNEGKILSLSKGELELGYRSSTVMKENYVVLSAKSRLQNGDKKEVKEVADDLIRKRESKQLLEYLSAGSTFKRPEGYSAEKLIQDAGLKGYSIGGAAAPEKHLGFVINKNGATAKDILDLIAYIQSEVKRQFDVELHPEVRITGEDKR